MHILSSIYSTYGKKFATFTRYAFAKYKKLLFMGLALLIFVLLLILAYPRTSFSDFTMQLFREELVGNTLNLHFTLANPESYGIENYDISLGNVSVDALAKQGEALLRARQELLSFKRDKLSAEEQLTYDVLTDYLDSQIALSEYYLYEEPFSYCGGVQVQLPILLAEYSFSDERDVREYLELTTLLDDYLGQLMEFEHAKADAGLFMSDELCQLTIESCKAFLENQENHYLLTTFEKRLESLDLPAGKRKQYIEMNRDTFLNQIIPAYENLILKLTALMGNGKNTGGLCNFPNGKDYYQALLRSETGCKDSVDEIFKRIETKRSADLLHSVELWEANHSIYEDCNNAMPNFGNSEAMLAQLEEAILADFPAPPATQCRISYVEEALRDYLAPAFYIVAPMDDYFENAIYINDTINEGDSIVDDATRPSDIYDFTTLAHEGFPGHLYQTVMSYEYNLPPIRCILDYPGFVEGWATYVEMMSYSYAGLGEEAADMLSCNQSAMLSLYATSDIGIHYYGWGKEEMYDFWCYFGICDHEAVDEITRLILAEPGNYLKYYVGYLEFLALRDDVQDTLGADFDLKEFHKTILDIGPAPFDVVREYWGEYYPD